MATGMLHTHLLSVILFLLHYLIKTVLLVFNRRTLILSVVSITCLFVIVGAVYQLNMYFFIGDIGIGGLLIALVAMGPNEFNSLLERYTKITRIPEMVISTLFLLTGIYLLTQIPEIKSLLIIKIVVVLASIPIAIIGFKKKNKALAVISLLMIITAYGLAEMSKKQKSKAMENMSANSVDGKEIYEASCISCHGADGKLMLAGAKDLSVSTLNLEQKIDIIKNGKNLMTGFGSTLNDEQIKAVAEYVETLNP